MKSKIKVGNPYGPIAGNRQVVYLEDICVHKSGIQTGPFGSQLHSSDYVDSGTPIVSVEHVGENCLNPDSAPLVSEEDVKRLAKYTLKSGDIVFSRVGSVDRRALVSANEEGWLFSGRLLRIRPNPDVVDSSYLSYFFGHPAFKSYIRSIAVGATMPSLNTGLLRSLPIVLPEFAEQKAIARVLQCLDQKITLNRELAKTLEDIAQTIFKSWFIDFNPVKAKMAGEKYVGMSDEVLALFPGSLGEFDLGLSPTDWTLSSLGEHISVTKGKSYKSTELVESDTALVTLKSFMRGGGYRFDGLKAFSGPYKPGQVVEPGELVVSFTDVTQAADVIGKPAIVLGSPKFQTLVASLDVGIVRAISKHVGKMFLYQLFLSSRFKRHVEGYTNGTTVLHLGQGALEDFLFPLPSEEVLAKFEEITEPLWGQIQSLYLQNLLLAEIRNALLPRLISGELQIPEEMLAS